jgi:archaemetzincin
VRSNDGIGALEFLAVGPVPPALVADVASRVSRAVSVPCRVAAAAPPFDVAAIDGRDQIDADRLLVDVERRAAGEGVVLAALVARDMANPIFTHFFGRARLGGRALIVSLARLSPAFYGGADDASLCARRAAIEVNHELGHVAGLRHCDDKRCLMHLAHTVDAIDVRGTTWCAACAARLPSTLSRGDGPQSSISGR